MLLSHSLVYIALELVIACLAVAGNVLVCWAVCLNSNLQSITNYFVVSLAVADIAVGLLAIPFSIVISTGFCADFHGCLFIACFVLVLTQSSIFSLLAIAVDRYIAIKIPLRYTSLVTGSRAKGIIAVCWVLSVGIGLTPMLGWNMGVNATNSSVCPYGMTECLFEGVVTLEYMVYFNFFGCVLVPLVAMLAIYARIFMAARRQLRLMELKQVSTHGNAHRQSSNSSSCRSTLQKEVHAAKSLAILVGLFALCWLPLHIINCFNLMCHDCGRPHIWVMNIAIIFSHANSVVNPIIYAYRIREFRHTFRRILRQHVLGQRQDCCMGKRADRGMGGSSSTKRASTQISMDVSCSTVINSYALEPYLDSSRHMPPQDVTLTSCHRTSRLEPVSIRFFPNGHPVDSSFVPSGQDCVMGSVVRGGLEPPFLKGTAGVLEVEDSGSILFMNQLPLPPAHSSPTISVELTEVS